MIVHCDAITDIDITVADMLERLDVELKALDIHLALVELGGRIQDLVVTYGLRNTLDRDHFCPNIDSALTAIARLDDEQVPKDTGQRDHGV